MAWTGELFGHSPGALAVRYRILCMFEKDRLGRIFRNVRRGLAGNQSDIARFEPENIVWVFCTGRSGSTWLASMLAELDGVRLWNEPLVGALFGEFYESRIHRSKGGPFIMGKPYKSTWLSVVREMVLTGSGVRYPDLNGLLVIKEPHGSVGAPILSEALPESRLIFLVRDPRDVVSSAFDGQRRGSWAAQTAARRGRREEETRTFAEKRPDGFARHRAELYLRDISQSKKAYEAHRGLKTQVRYEDLRSQTLPEMRRVCSDLGILAEEKDIVQVVEKHAWEAIPEKDRGQGKFYRKATPGGWREDLSREQIQIVEEITTPLLDEFYPGWRDGGEVGR
jgi:hypothetical protein